MSDTKEMVVYHAKDGWRWHEVTSSDITADSGEAYDVKAEAIDVAKAHMREGYTLVIKHERYDEST